MSEYRKYLRVNDGLFDYARSYTTEPDDIQRRLISRTMELGDRMRMQVGHDQAMLLTFLARAMRVRNAIEIGTFTGYSALAIARGLRPDGRLIACDISEEWTAIAREAWVAAGVEDRIDLCIGPALDTVLSLPDDATFELAFIDADKESYIGYYEALLPRLDPDGLILADNTLWEGKVVDPSCDDEATRAIRAFNEHVASDPRTEAVLLPFADGVTLIRRRAPRG